MRCKVNRKNADGSGSVLIICPFFSPNVGGVETRFDNIVGYLDRKGIKTWVQTYQPITSSGVSADPYERRGRLAEIWRSRWIGGDLFHRLLKYPILEALYLCPALFVKCFCFLLKHGKRIKVIHAAGFNGALIARLLNFVFCHPYVVTIHALYNLRPKSNASFGARWILKKANKVLALSETSRRDILNSGISQNVVDVHVNWIDINLFRPMEKERCKKALGIRKKFVVVMVGRLKEIKGVRIALELCERFARYDIAVLLAGNGELREDVVQAASRMSNLIFVGSIPNRQLPKIYNSGDISLVPSIYPEGFARVVLESLGCGIPVIGSHVGCIPEEVDDKCAILVEPNVEKFEQAVLELYNDPIRLQRMSEHARSFCVKRYSEKNMSSILEAYGFEEDTLAVQ